MVNIFLCSLGENSAVTLFGECQILHEHCWQCWI